MYGREIEGTRTTFGTTGYTYEQTFLLYDRQTDSVWWPLKEGQLNAVSGPLRGMAIPFLANPEVVNLSHWRKQHPGSRVLVDAEPED